MIRAVCDSNQDEFYRVCNQERLFGPQLYTCHAVYGSEDRSACFWLATASDGSPAGALCRREGLLAVAALPGCDPEEVSFFADSLGGFSRIQGPADFCRALYPGRSCAVRTAPAMEYCLADPGESGCAEPLSSIAEAYAILKAAAPGQVSQSRDAQSAWHVLTSHILRHGLGVAAGVYRDGVLAATGGIYGQSDAVCTIGNIATHPEYRRQGFAAMIIHYLVRYSLQQGKTPALLCANDNLQPYYGKLGFAVTEAWGDIILPLSEETL